MQPSQDSYVLESQTTLVRVRAQPKSKTTYSIKSAVVAKVVKSSLAKMISFTVLFYFIQRKESENFKLTRGATVCATVLLHEVFF